MQPLLVVNLDAFIASTTQAVLLMFPDAQMAALERTSAWINKVWRPWVQRTITHAYLRTLNSADVPALGSTPAEATAVENTLTALRPASAMLLSAREHALHQQQQQQQQNNARGLFASAPVVNLRTELFDRWTFADPSVWEHYENGSLCIKVNATEPLVNQLHHVCEALYALYADRPDWLRISVDQAALAAHRWTTELWRKAVASGGQRTHYTPFHSGDATWRVSLLEDRAAYESEGARMHHCVASYWGRQNTTIYSLQRAVLSRPDEDDDRDFDPDNPDNTLINCDDIQWEPMLTVEVVGSEVRQVRGDHNAAPNYAQAEALAAWCLPQHLRYAPPKPTVTTNRFDVGVAGTNIELGAAFVRGDVLANANVNTISAHTQNVAQLRANLLRDISLRFAVINNLEVMQHPQHDGFMEITVRGSVDREVMQRLMAALRQ